MVFERRLHRKTPLFDSLDGFSNRMFRSRAQTLAITRAASFSEHGRPEQMQGAIR
jgi:hypothetical protein